MVSNQVSLSKQLSVPNTGPGKTHIWVERIIGVITQGALADCFKRFPIIAMMVLNLFPGPIKKAIEDTRLNERYSIELVRK